MKNLIKHFILFLFGAIIYLRIEIIYRGYSHWTMAILGGLCFVLLGLINEIIPWEMLIWKQMFIGMVMITALEFITGCIVNIYLKWDVWDYSDLPLNVLGQICLPFSIAWYFISMFGIILDDWLRYWLFGEEKPHYNW